ncbi:c-type cytochrome [Phaeovulum vinaykumarii]|nr:c-type cytochrome [Phaeovulum vinaykumarii]
MGKRAFDAVCASCHGQNASGRDGIAAHIREIQRANGID